MNELALLLDNVAAFVRRYVVITNVQADAIALWIAHTHALDACEQTSIRKLETGGTVALTHVVQLASTLSALESVGRRSTSRRALDAWVVDSAGAAYRMRGDAT